METMANGTAVKALILGAGESTRDLGGRSGFLPRITGEETAGAIFIADGFIPPKHAGPALHVHSREDEIYLVIEGTLTVQVGDSLSEVGAGGLVWLPRGIPHTFANRTETQVRTIGIILPTGIEAMFAEVNAYMRSLSGRGPDPERIAAIEAPFGLKTVGPQIRVD